MVVVVVEVEEAKARTTKKRRQWPRRLRCLPSLFYFLSSVRLQQDVIDTSIAEQRQRGMAFDLEIARGRGVGGGGA